LQIPSNVAGAAIGTSCAHPIAMSDQAEQLKKRTFLFAVSIVNLVRALPATFEGRRVGGQLFDAGTSVAANYRAACKARSHAEFIAKIGIVLEEADESEFWLEFLVATSIVPETAVKPHRSEASELSGDIHRLA
jgi:four helix bundle protein